MVSMCTGELWLQYGLGARPVVISDPVYLPCKSHMLQKCTTVPHNTAAAAMLSCKVP